MQPIKSSSDSSSTGSGSKGSDTSGGSSQGLSNNGGSSGSGSMPSSQTGSAPQSPSSPGSQTSGTNPPGFPPSTRSQQQQQLLPTCPNGEKPNSSGKCPAASSNGTPKGHTKDFGQGFSACSKDGKSGVYDPAAARSKRGDEITAGFLNIRYKLF